MESDDFPQCYKCLLMKYSLHFIIKTIIIETIINQFNILKLSHRISYRTLFLTKHFERFINNFIECRILFYVWFGLECRSNMFNLFTLIMLIVKITKMFRAKNNILQFVRSITAQLIYATPTRQHFLLQFYVKIIL